MAAAVADLQPHMSKQDLNSFYDKVRPRVPVLASPCSLGRVADM